METYDSGILTVKPGIVKENEVLYSHTVQGAKFLFPFSAMGMPPRRRLDARQAML
jgi:hypothetical protein